MGHDADDKFEKTVQQTLIIYGIGSVTLHSFASNTKTLLEHALTIIESIE